MAHRSRSRTAESVDGNSKKAKGTPRRLTEKIAMMKKREHQQSEAFNEAMKSIFEMQQARIHPGGGSMPSLAAIDSTAPNSIDMQSVFKDFNEVKHHGAGSFSTGKERPHSGGTGGRSRLGAERRGNSHMDTDPYPPVGSLSVSDHHYWNASPEWMEGDLARHKSDSDLQQSLMMQGSPQHLLHPLGSPQQQHRNHKLNTPGDLGLWRRPNSMTSALLSPDQYSGSEAPIPSPLGMSGTGTASSSLPDLTNIEFSSGLDVPLEHDDTLNDQPVLGGGGGGVMVAPFHSPTTKVPPVPSQLVYSSFQAQHHQFQNSFHQQQQQQQQQHMGGGGGRFFTPYSSAMPYGSGLQQSANFGGLRQISPLMVQSPPSIGGMVKSPTMPDFKTLHASPAPPLNSFFNSQNPPQLGNGHGPQFNAHFLASSGGNCLPPYRPPQGVPFPNFTAPHMMGGKHQSAAAPPPMTIIIQPPPSSSCSTNFPQHQQPQQQQQQPQQQQQQQQQQSPQKNKSANKPPPLLNSPPTQQTPSLPTPPPLIQPDDSSGILSAHNFIPAASGATFSSAAAAAAPSPPKLTSSGALSLPNTPVITLSSGLPVLPSYIEAKQQQALQERFASFNVNRQENMMRSHSEENLQKAQKEKGDLMHNPFMGTLANANSVPCVYVEATNMETLTNERSDSPTPGDSPSTSASYASSPPSVRPYWADHSHSMNEFVFNEWPLEGAAAADRNKMGGSPPVHHKSLTDLNTIPEIGEFLQSNRNRQFLHQLSLPSVAMTDLAVDELEKQNSPTYYMPSAPADFEMEDEVMDDLLKNEVPDLEPFMISDGLMSSSPDAYLPNQLSSNY